jgi:serine/threonine-protein kinase
VGAFQDGRRYIEQGNCDAAVTKLRESLAHEPSIGARLSLADCIEATDPVGAWSLLEEAAAHAYVAHDDRLQVIEQRAAALEKKTPNIVLTIPPATMETAGFELRVDGVFIDRYVYKSGVIVVKPGRHLLEASAPGRRWSDSVNVDASLPARVSVLLQQEPCAPGSAPPAGAGASTIAASGDSPGSTRRTLGLTLAGVGLAGIASGVVFGIVTLSKKGSIDAACGGNAGNCQAPPGSVDGDRDAANTTATISTASFIAGSVALLGGAALYFTAPSATTGKVRVSPSVARAGAGLGLEGMW